MTIWSHNQKYFSKLTLSTCYWGGFLAADGSVSEITNSVRLRLSTKDLKHVERFKQAVSYDGPVYFEPKTGSCGVTLYSSRCMRYDLENAFNIVPNKSLTLKPPPVQLLSEGRQLEKAFLVGFIDGDGCIRYDKRDGLLVLDVFSGSLRMIRWAKELLETEYNLPDKKIFTSTGAKAHLYRLIGKNAEIVRSALSTYCEDQLQRKWNPEVPMRELRDRRKVVPA